MLKNLPAKVSNKILVTRNKDNSEITLFYKGSHFRKTARDIGKEGVEQLFNAAMDYKNTGSSASQEAIDSILSPKGALIRKLFNGEFYTDGVNVFLQGDKIPVPRFLVETLKEWEKNGWDIKSLVNFWILCRLNPNPHSRDSFFTYCQNHGVVITDYGYAVLYKAVTHKSKVENNKDLAKILTEGIAQAKKKRKGAGKYTVFKHVEEDTYRVSTSDNPQEGEEVLGNLKVMYDNIEQYTKGVKTTVYTDKHSRSMNIHIGVPVKMPRELCDPNIKIDCSKGLHVGSYSYVKKFGTTGDTVFTCLVNPMNVVAIPEYDTSKIRVCEYLPRAVMKGGENMTWEELPSAYYEDDYIGYELKELKGLLESGSTMEAEREVVKTRLISVEREQNRTKDTPFEAMVVYEEENEKGEQEMRLLEEGDKEPPKKKKKLFGR